jgi:hypothetical protein
LLRIVVELDPESIGHPVQSAAIDPEQFGGSGVVAGKLDPGSRSTKGRGRRNQ